MIKQVVCFIEIDSWYFLLERGNQILKLLLWKINGISQKNGDASLMRQVRVDIIRSLILDRIWIVLHTMIHEHVVVIVWIKDTHAMLVVVIVFQGLLKLFSIVGQSKSAFFMLLYLLFCHLLFFLVCQSWHIILRKILCHTLSFVHMSIHRSHGAILLAIKSQYNRVVIQHPLTSIFDMFKFWELCEWALIQFHLGHIFWVVLL